MTDQKVFRPYSQVEIRDVLSSRPARGQRAESEFQPKGISASAIFAQRRADLSSASVPAAPHADEPAVTDPSFARGVFAMRRQIK
jgi:hypothetical protein